MTQNWIWIGKVYVILIATIGYLLITTPAASAQAHVHRAFPPMPLQEMMQNQVNAGLYTPQRRQAEGKLTDALYARSPRTAIALLEEAAQIDASFDKPWMYACDLYQKIGQYKEAATACEKAANILPNYGFYVMRLAEAQELAKLPAQAITNYNRAETIYLNNNTPDIAAIARANSARVRQVFGLP